MRGELASTVQVERQGTRNEKISSERVSRCEDRAEISLSVDTRNRVRFPKRTGDTKLSRQSSQANKRQARNRDHGQRSERAAFVGEIKNVRQGMCGRDRGERGEFVCGVERESRK